MVGVRKYLAAGYSCWQQKADGTSLEAFTETQSGVAPPSRGWVVKATELGEGTTSARPAARYRVHVGRAELGVVYLL